MKLTINNYHKLNDASITILGAKNSALPIIASTILLDGDTTLYNIPNISDVQIMLELLTELGLSATLQNNTLHIHGSAQTFSIKNPSSKLIRGSYYFYSTLLSTFNKVISYLPGGCDIGSRPINFHLDSFKLMGCSYKIINDRIFIYSSSIHPAIIKLPFQSVGATINIIMLAVKTLGKTIIHNASLEPEVIDLINFLKRAGANITIDNTSIFITGVKRLSGIKYQIIPDRIEAGSYLIWGLCNCFSSLTICNINPTHLTSVIKTLEKIGAKLTIHKNKITIFPITKVTPIIIKSGVYPDFPTDLIQIISSILLLSNNPSIISDGIFDNRFKLLGEFIKIGAIIKKVNNTYYINSENLKNNKTLIASDLRGAFALFVCAFLCTGTIHIDNYELLLRGYNDFASTLNRLKVSYSIS